MDRFQKNINMFFRGLIGFKFQLIGMLVVLDLCISKSKERERERERRKGEKGAGVGS